MSIVSDGIAEYKTEYKNAASLATLTFEADSALLRELGERLVGKPYVALAELIKNAYDADAKNCLVVITEDRIVVSDDGHGMSEKDFRKFWMRIGTAHKAKTGKSKKFERPLTGSKGVGRLAAQFLASRLQIVTKKKKEKESLHAFVDWDEATRAGDLVEAEAFFQNEPTRLGTFPGDSSQGTSIILDGLKQSWDEKAVTELARQIWRLNSPIAAMRRGLSPSASENSFVIKLETPDSDLDEDFSEIISKAIENYEAEIVGSIRRVKRKDGTRVCRSRVEVKFKNAPNRKYTFYHDPSVKSADWVIRVFNLSGRQEGGIAVGDMREYFRDYGGVMMFDAGFRLPFYGAGNDWLDLEYDHSHRKVVSNLLPMSIQEDVDRGLNDLPTQGRVYGVVEVNTGAEDRASKGSDHLKIQISRDRLVQNDAYKVIKDAVRQSLDFYSVEKRRYRSKQFDMRGLEVMETRQRVSRATELLDRIAASYPKDKAVTSLVHELEEIDERIEIQRKAEISARGLLAPLASAGMMAVAMDHEIKKDLREALATSKQLGRMARKFEDEKAALAAETLTASVKKVIDLRKVFAPLATKEDRENVDQYRCKPLLKTTVRRLRPFLGPIRTTYVGPQDVSFPNATYVEWSALAQNILLNAANATLDIKNPKLRIEVETTDHQASVTFSDNGVGVDLDTAEELFRPFERRMEISDERRELGLGGIGLGLTIVRMIASQRKCEIKFVEPSDDFTTAIKLSWKV